MAHTWNDIQENDLEIRLLPLAKQPDGLDVPLFGLPYGAFYARLASGADLVRLERAIRRGQLTGLVAIKQPQLWLVYARGRRRGPEWQAAACAWSALGCYVERPGWRKRLAVWLLTGHDQGTAHELAEAARELPV